MTTVSVTMVMIYNAFITFAGDIRNDLYVTLEKGEFEKGNDILHVHVALWYYLTIRPAARKGY